MRHAIHPEADAEFAEAVQYYAQIDPELGKRCFHEVERTIRIVCESPQRFLLFDPPARRALVHGFPYAVVFLEQPDRVWIVAVMHGKRRPGYWKSRIG